MRHKNLYEITFYVRKGYFRTYMIHIEAYNQKEAREIAEELWYKNYDAHMFRIYARKVPLDEVVDMKHWFSIFY